MREKLFKTRDIFIILAIVIIATTAIFLLQPKQKGNVAVVTYNGSVIMEIDLGKDAVYHIDADLPVTLEVIDGRIRFIDPQCPDKLCEGFGLIGEEYEYAICMPAKVSVQIKSA